MIHRFTTAKRMMAAAAGAVAIAMSFGGSPTLALDPFRTSNPHEIGNTSEKAFRTLFEEGNYTKAASYLKEAEAQEPNEPLVYAMQAAFASLNEDSKALNSYATKTRATAEQLIKTDPLRGNIYTAVGHFLEGAYIIQTEGTVNGAPKALNKLQQVFGYLNEAEKIEPKDPELNLIKGFMDLMLSSALPFSNANDAIARLENYAGPRYVAYRGIAVGYRDLDQHDKALAAVEQAMQLTPKNPELFYLKAQILVDQGKAQKSVPKLQEAQTNFEAAIAQKDHFPEELRKQLQKERDRNSRRIQQMTAANQ